MPIDEVQAMENDISEIVQATISSYPALWRNLIKEWQSKDNENAAWLTYSANYLLRSGGTRWALDPFFLFHRVGIEHKRNLASDLSPLELVILSHGHHDHYDLELIKLLSQLPIQWIIPEFMVKHVMDGTNLSPDKVVIPQPGNIISFRNLKILPFESLHFREAHGVPEMGYMVEFDRKRWLFPGDIRTHDPSRLPDFGNLDGVFAHLWLGKSQALLDAPPLLDDFVTFFSNFNTRKIVITHMNEIGRKPAEIWSLRHFQMILEKFRKMDGSIEIQPAQTGQKVKL